jgi:hypothetical protein
MLSINELDSIPDANSEVLLPLETLLGSDKAIDFMFMHSFNSKAGVRIYAYQNIDNKQYIFIVSDGHTYYQDGIPMNKIVAVKHVYN